MELISLIVSAISLCVAALCAVYTRKQTDMAHYDFERARGERVCNSLNVMMRKIALKAKRYGIDSAMSYVESHVRPQLDAYVAENLMLREDTSTWLDNQISRAKMIGQCPDLWEVIDDEEAGVLLTRMTIKHADLPVQDDQPDQR